MCSGLPVLHRNTTVPLCGWIPAGTGAYEQPAARGASHIQIERSLTTSSVAVFVPFVTQELFQGGDAMYYGINAKTGNMIMLVPQTGEVSQRAKAGDTGKAAKV